ncbi:tetratricopeptide repeat protein, partial [candidate division KSB1 bacterium]|nr:tetratricopeptide repeat protein [candidate division KSB1 bacterium]
YKSLALYGLARTLQLQGNIENALVNFSAVVDSFPKTGEAMKALYQIGDIRMNQLFDPLAARDAYQIILKRYPRSSNRFDAIFKIGDTYSAQGDFKNARQWYQKPLQEQSLHTEIRSHALYRLALLDFGEEKWEDAVKKLEAITKTGSENLPGDEQTLVNDALDLMLLIQECKTEKEPLALYSRTLLLEYKRLWSEAIDTLNVILALFPQSKIADDAALRIGTLEYLRKNYNSSIDAYRRLIRDYSDSYLCERSKKRIAEIYENELGDSKAAQLEYEQFMTQYPNSLYLEEIRKKVRTYEKHL